MALTDQLEALVVRLGTEFKALRGSLGSNTNLNTVHKSTLVGAINEVSTAVTEGQGAQINDTAPSTSTVYSSQKTEQAIASAVAGSTQIDDATTSTTKTWSSQKINTELGTKAVINDTGASSTAVWSASKTNTQINNAVAAKPSINDTTPSSTAVYSSNQTEAKINQKVADLVGAAPETLDTLAEIAAALQGEQGAVDALETSVANRVRFDAPQTLNATQKAQARSNIDAASATDVGGTAIDLVAAFETALA